jgi:hypothetical protein
VNTKHITTNARRCPCPDCRAAWATYMRNYRRKVGGVHERIRLRLYRETAARYRQEHPAEFAALREQIIAEEKAKVPR